MSNIQKILFALADQLHTGNISEDMCVGLAVALSGVPEEYHMKAFEAMLKTEENNA